MLHELVSTCRRAPMLEIFPLTPDSSVLKGRGADCVQSVESGVHFDLVLLCIWFEQE